MRHALSSTSGRAALAALVVATACARGTAPPSHLLLVTVDTLRADQLGLYGAARPTSPAIDALGRRGVVFEHAVVQWPVTTPSMASMFTGLYPHQTGVVILARPNPVPERFRMLPEVLHERGFATAAVVANAVLGRPNGFDRGFDDYRALWLDDVPGATRAAHATDVALEELRRLAARGGRFFLWVHYLDPHDPYDPPPGYAEPFLHDAHMHSRTVPVNADNSSWKGISARDYERAGRDADLGRYLARYDGEVRYTDEQIGRLLEGLAALRLDDDTLVVFAADHGESIGDHDLYLNHGLAPYEEQVRVPLVFRWPGDRFAGRRVDKPVELRWLARSLLDALGVPEAENPFEGASLVPAARGGATAYLPDSVFSEAGATATRWNSMFTLAIRHGALKLVLPRSDWARGMHGGREVELYDLGTDPSERVDLAASRPREVSLLRAELLRWFHSGKPWSSQATPESAMDAKTEAALRELGYLD